MARLPGQYGNSNVPPMGSVTVRVFASHPLLSALYEHVVESAKGLKVVRDGEPFQVGVFDGTLVCLEAGLTLLRLKFSSMRPVLVWQACDERECLRLLFRGFCGLVTFDRYEGDLIPAVRAVANGELWFPTRAVQRWQRIRAERRMSGLEMTLTQRECKVLAFLFRRLSNKEIAEILHISERTVKFHVGNILEKLDMRSRDELSATWVPDLGLT